MTSFHRILFPVDFSEQCLRAAPSVEAFAHRFHSELTLLHVFDTNPPIAGMQGTPAWSVIVSMEEARAARRRDLELFLAYGFSGIKVHREMAEGDPAEQIACYAKENNVDLVMMPTHGYGRFRGLLLGSVTAKVLHDVDCPVWTNAHTTEPPTDAPGWWRTIVCAVDTNPRDIQVLRWAADFAQDQGAEVHLVHAIQGTSPDHFDSPAFYQLLTKFAEEAVARMQREAGTDFQVTVAGGTPGHIVHAAATEHKAGLVVIGRGVLKEAFGRLRSNAYSIIRDSPCPVISI